MNIFDVLILQPIFNLLLGLYSVIPGGDFGVAVIIFTILVRLALWPLVKKQLHQVKAMQKLQPELVRIKKQAKGNKQLEGMQMMELYKKHDVSPFRSIGILLIQLPIFIALYNVIQIFTLHRNQIEGMTYGFLKNLGPIKAIIDNPDVFNQKLLGVLDLTKHAITTNPFSINILLLLLSVVAVIIQYIMTKQTTPKVKDVKTFKEIMSETADGKQASQEEMNAIVTNNMMKFLPIMMFFVMINLPGALALYYTVSNLMAVLQQRSILKKDTEEMIEIADDTKEQQHKKATAKAREKQATEANITRITAKDSAPRGSKKKG